MTSMTVNTNQSISYRRTPREGSLFGGVPLRGITTCVGGWSREVNFLGPPMTRVFFGFDRLPWHDSANPPTRNNARSVAASRTDTRINAQQPRESPKRGLDAKA